MSFVPAKLPARSAAPKISEWGIEEISGGINLEDQEYKLDDDQSPSALNVWFNNRILSKRWGYRKINATAMPAILTGYRYLFLGYFIVAAGTGLYKIDPGTGLWTQIMSGMAAQRGRFFKYNNKLYYINGAQYVAWDGTSCAAVTPYIPTVVINRTSTGGGTVNEDYNRLGSGFRNSFHGTGAAVAFQLTDTNLDDAAVTATVGGVAKVEGTDFTVNRLTGVVTFVTAPAAGTNNVIITAYKTVAAQINSILTCTVAIAFGGQNDNRIFFAGNGTPYYYWSGVIDPSYIPLTQYNIIGSNDDAITAFGVQYDVLVIFKKRQMGAVTYQYDTTTGKAYFPYYNINSSIGCDCPDTVELINNQLTWLTSYGGVYTLIGTAVREQKDVQPISRNINGNNSRGGLLGELNLTSASACCFRNAYWLCVGSKVYLWDYGVRPFSYTGNTEQDARKLGWWIFDNIDANTWMDSGSSLYFGDGNGFTHVLENSYADNGVAINAYWKMAIRDFGAPEWEKTVSDIYLTCQTKTNATLAIKYFTDRSADGITDRSILNVAAFSLATLDLSKFVLGVLNIAKSYRRKINLKGIVYFALMVSNNTAYEDLNISDIKIRFNVNRLVR